jgi:AraC-like DNA-binding protein
MKETNGSQQVHGIQAWLERAAAARWCVQQLAEQAGFSISKLERLFHAEYRLCPQDWLTTQRMKRAAEWLAQGRNVNETAELVGYGSQHAFSLAFKRHFGYPPKEHHARQLAIANGQTGKRANGQTGKRANGQTGKRANGQTGKRANGQTYVGPSKAR